MALGQFILQASLNLNFMLRESSSDSMVAKEFLLLKLVFRLQYIIIFLFLISSCTYLQKGDENQVADIVQERIGKDIFWHPCGQPDPFISEYIQNLISQPISSETAVQIALLNNPNIQATFEEIGIAQADLVEAGLFSNPIFEIEVRYPHEKKLKTNVEYLVTTAFLDIFLIPLRKKLAATELEQAKLRVANEILNLAFEVRQTYYSLIAEQQMIEYKASLAELADTRFEIAKRQNSIGNIYQLDFEQVQASFLEAELELFKSQEEIIRLTTKLNRLLGVSEDLCLNFSEKLPEILEDIKFDLCQLERTALEERIDLQAARYEVIRFSQMLGLKDWWTYTNLNTGLAGEREPDGANLIGFGAKGEIPIFNFGQAARLRIFAQFRQAQERLAALEIQILSEVRESYRILIKDLKILQRYKADIFPLQSKILNSSEALYNVMGMGIDRLLDAKKKEVETINNYLVILRDYWIERVKLDYALGGYLFRLLPELPMQEAQ